MNFKLIRKYLSSKVGNKVKIIYYGSRNKKERYEGILYNTYCNIFVIKTLSGELKSFSYIDILIKNIRVLID